MAKEVGAPERSAVAGRVYALKASVEVLEAADGRVYLLRPGAADLVVPEPEEADRRLLEVLAEPATVEGLVARLGVDADAVQEKLAALEAVDVLATWADEAEPLMPSVAARFDRQLPYLATYGPPAERQRALAEATVAVIGCGGLGTWALGGLACAGIGRFVLVDDDTVEPSNLNRQVLYVEADVGRPKVERAADWVGRFAPGTEVTAMRRRVRSAEDVAPIAEAADVVLMLADDPPYVLERWVNAACVAARTPYIACGQATPIVKIGPLYLPGRTACFACEETQMRAVAPLYDEVVAMRQRTTAARAITLGPASGIVGTLLSAEVMHHLLGGQAATEGRAMVLDIRTFDVSWEPIARDPGCPVCGALWAS